MTIIVNNVLIENDEGYMHLGQHYSLKEKNHGKELQQRFMTGWANTPIQGYILKQPCDLSEEICVSTDVCYQL